MGTRESHEPGTFSWAELATNDAAAAKDFYRAVLGWEFEDSDTGEGGVYSMGKVDGRWVGALFGTSDAPPHWNSYVTVASADETADKARASGGEVVREPFDVPGAGRMAVIRDPTGAMICVWEAKEHPGAGLVNAPGALTWNDLMTTDVGAAAEFYCAVFGWEVAEVPEAPDDRVAIRNGERMNGGMATIPEAAGGDVPPHWIPYFAVSDVDATVETATSHGGQAMAPALDIPAGRFALLADPQGAVFAVFSGEMED